MFFIAWQVILHAAALQLEHDLAGNEKPLTTVQAGWYFNKRSFYEEF